MRRLGPPDAPAPASPPVRRDAVVRRHGGAWKVAYADFVTALMSLFIVLWLVNTNKAVKQSVAGYFRDPRGYTRKAGTGPAGPGEGLLIHRDNVRELEKKIQLALRKAPLLDKIRDNVKLTVTGEGLRIDLMENEQGTFFVTGSAAPTPAGQQLLSLLGAELAKLSNGIVIEGHTDSRPFRNAVPTNGYGNWELSVDRANAARRLLNGRGIRSEQVAEVRGFADQRLLLASDPEGARNRRVSVVVKFEDGGSE